jgi:uncharacterized protein (TIGR02246 family)
MSGWRAVVIVGVWMVSGVASGQDDSNPLKAVMDQYVAAFNKVGHKEPLAFWADDADYTTSDGEIFRGRDAILKLMTSDAVPGTRLNVAEQTVRVIKTDVALQEGVLVHQNPKAAATTSATVVKS